MQNTNTDQKQRGLRILSLGMLDCKSQLLRYLNDHPDDGGVRGLSELFILREIMFRLMHLEKSKSVPKPWEYFDIIGGAGTGGVIALMLGRLHMPINLAIKQYDLFSRKVFSDVKMLSRAEKYKATTFEDGMRAILQSAGFPPDVLMQEDNPLCRSFVVALPSANMTPPRIFRTYKVSANQGDNCTVVEAARATTAIPDLFEPVSISSVGVSESFVGAGLGYSNPTNLTLEEAEMAFGLSQPVECLTTVKAHRGGTVSTKLSNKKTLSKQQILLPIVSAPSPLFVGREDILSDLEKYFDSHISSFKMQVQRRYVLHGLGGAGKTQIAQKFCSKFGSSSKASIEQFLTPLAQSAKTDATPAAALIWLCHQKEEWLMIFDNADDPNIDLHKFFPDCSHGNILITSRNERSMMYATKSHQKIAEMTLEDSLAVFYKASHRAKDEQEAAIELVKELGFLALAIVQAGSYLLYNPHITVKQYLQSYKKDVSRYLAETGKQTIDRYQLSVFATWDLSYQKLNKEAKAILMLCSVLHKSKIPMSILERAWTSLPTIQEIDTQELQDFLGIFSTHNKDWSDELLEKAVDMLRSYSLVEIQGRHGMLLEIHSLVHSWTFESLSEDEQRKAKKCAQQLFYCLGNKDLKYNDAAQWVLHLCALMNHLNYKCENYKLAKRLQVIFSEAQFWSDTEPLYQQVLRECKEELGSTHEDTIQAMSHLARAFRISLKLEEAEKLEQEVLKVRREASGTDHPDTIKAMSNLALTLQNSQKPEEIEKLVQEVLKISTKAFETDHSDIIEVMPSLALLLWTGGRLEEAEKLQKKVLKIKREAFGTDHPDTIEAMFRLAITLWTSGKLEEAEKLQQEVCKFSTEAFGTDHPNTIKAISLQALIFSSAGKLEKAEKLLQKVLKISREVFGTNDPHIIETMSNLAATFANGRKLKEAEKLDREVLKIRTKIFGNSHIRTIEAKTNLASTLRNSEKLEEAEKLEQEVLKFRTEVSGNSHPLTIEAMYNLAATLKKSGKLEEAEDLSKKCSELGGHCWKSLNKYYWGQRETRC
ncbi:hypothetical protein C0992_003580 [Termitomyces sp. T32_za158]|nr:hypothetical protein C0992_003580 [Termitomyces sp. T32_za158]